MSTLPAFILTGDDVSISYEPGDEVGCSTLLVCRHDDRAVTHVIGELEGEAADVVARVILEGRKAP